MSTPDPTHRFSWLPDDAPPVEVDLSGTSFAVVAGPSCSPSVYVGAFEETEPADARLMLYFDGFPEVGMRATLPDTQAPSTDPLFVTTHDPYHHEAFLGGRVEVVQFDAAGWEFRLEGEDFSRCVDSHCTAISGGNVTILPIDPDSTEMRDPWEGCYAGEPFFWPDGWEACVVDSAGGEGECPDTLPW